VERAARARRTVGRTADDFAEAIRPHLGRLNRHIASRVPRALAEDVTQDALLRAFRSWPTFDRSRPLWPWLARIAQRACMTAWQVDSRWRRAEATDPTAAAPGDSPGSDQHVAAVHARSIVAAVLADLTDRERTLLYRSEGEGTPRWVLAREIALTPGAARVALHRARHRFRESAARRWDDIGVAAAFALGRVRLRLRGRESAVSTAGSWAWSASVLVTVIASAVVQNATGQPAAAREDSSAHAAVRHVVGTSLVGQPPQGQRPSPASANAPGLPGRQETQDATSPRRSPSVPSPLVEPVVQADVGPDGVYGGVRVDWTLPNDGNVWANPHIGCRHSTATQAVCTVTGSLPSAGPVEFYGSGDGDS
jgi:RNA polymerase sigma factor (sigma-70 family)